MLSFINSIRVVLWVLVERRYFLSRFKVSIFIIEPGTLGAYADKLQSCSQAMFFPPAALLKTPVCHILRSGCFYRPLSAQAFYKFLPHPQVVYFVAAVLSFRSLNLAGQWCLLVLRHLIVSPPQSRKSSCFFVHVSRSLKFYLCYF